MIDYFQRQIDRSTGRLSAIRPRLPSLYEPRDLKDSPGQLSPEEWQAAERIPVRNRRQSPEPGAAASVRERPHEDGQGLLRAETLEGLVSDGDAASVRTPSLKPIPVPKTPPAATDAFHQRGRPVLISSPDADAMPARNEFSMHRDTDDRSQGIAERKEFRQKTAESTGEKPREDHLPPQRGFAPNPALFPADSPPVMRDNRALRDPSGREITQGERNGPSKRAVPAQTPVRPAIQSLQKPLTVPSTFENTAVPALPSPPPEQTIRVTIGRIDVRAVMPPPAAVQQKPAPPQPKVTLEEYLKKQWGGQR